MGVPDPGQGVEEVSLIGPSVDGRVRLRERRRDRNCDRRRAAWPAEPRQAPYMSDPGVVSRSPVSSHVLSPERIIGQPP